jgi:hypothetical protein
MRFHVSCFFIVCAVVLQAENIQPRLSFHVMGNDPDGWPELLSSLGLTSGTGGGDSVIVAPHGTSLPPAEWAARVEHGAILVLEGESPLSGAFGFRAGAQRHVSVRSVEDLRAPDLGIIWEKALDLPVFEILRMPACSLGSARKSAAPRRISQRCGRCCGWPLRRVRTGMSGFLFAAGVARPGTAAAFFDLHACGLF